MLRIKTKTRRNPAGFKRKNGEEGEWILDPFAAVIGLQPHLRLCKEGWSGRTLPLFAPVFISVRPRNHLVRFFMFWGRLQVLFIRFRPALLQINDYPASSTSTSTQDPPPKTAIRTFLQKCLLSLMTTENFKSLKITQHSIDQVIRFAYPLQHITEHRLWVSTAVQPPFFKVIYTARITKSTPFKRVDYGYMAYPQHTRPSPRYVC